MIRRFAAIRPALWLSSAVLIASGCENKPTTSTGTAADAAVERAKTEIGQAADAAMAAARAKRDEYAVEMQKQLAEMDAKLADLNQRASKAEGQAKADLEKKWNDSKAKRDEAARRLEDLKSSAGDRWEKVKGGVGDAFDDLKKAFE